MYLEVDRRSDMLCTRKIAPYALLSLIVAWTAAALADPPDHAPAHGWRQKHDPFYVGYTGRHWDHDYGILSGHCNREAVATVLGGVVGGVIGSRVGDDDNRTVATIIGVAAGALIGNKIGRELDEADRSCIGHALEVGQPGQVVRWTNQASGVEYQMVLKARGDNNSRSCREYTLFGIAGDKKSFRQGVACQVKPGVWSIDKPLKA
jgi:surface antigen